MVILLIGADWIGACFRMMQWYKDIALYLRVVPVDMLPILS